MDFSAILAHYGHLLISYLFGAAVAAVIVMVIHRVFQPFLLSLLDELRASSEMFKRLLHKESPNAAERGLLGQLALAYAIVSGLFFLGIMLLLSSLATPLG